MQLSIRTCMIAIAVIGVTIAAGLLVSALMAKPQINMFSPEIYEAYVNAWSPGPGTIAFDATGKIGRESDFDPTCWWSVEVMTWDQKPARVDWTHIYDGKADPADARLVLHAKRNERPSMPVLSKTIPFAFAPGEYLVRARIHREAVLDTAGNVLEPKGQIALGSAKLDVAAPSE
jgi:hypothetical protein